MIALGLAGTSSGNDFDIGLLLPLLPSIHIQLGPIDFYLNSPYFFDAINARKLVQSDPNLLAQWLAYKAHAKQFAQSESEYCQLKADWHKANGLPYMHYQHKAI